ncbi:hypothetical protein TWF718_003048 [Orbilia javanica]|uniref:Uncharacterized protein n=1 Tax=Orbilia javanica TaxID=47235 RepID=A0AAN8MTC3_9PEZI
MLFSNPWRSVPQDPDDELELRERSSFLHGFRVNRPQTPKWLQTPYMKYTLYIYMVFITCVIVSWSMEDEKTTPITQGQQDDYYFHPPIPMRDLTDPPLPPAYNIVPSTNSYQGLGNGKAPRIVTPLFIPFTRNHKMLEQTVLSYIAAGWPRSNIIVIDNTGTMDANPKGLLSPNNIFYLNYELLRNRYGVSILQTPTLLSFAQVQNFMISTVMSKGWKYYFWSHQDVVVASYEDRESFKGFYHGILESLSQLNNTMGPEAGENRWAVAFYAYDWLTLINVDTMVLIGAWDVFIPYYVSDCDWYERMHMSGLKHIDVDVGLVYDVSTNIDGIEKLLFGSKGGTDGLNSSRFQELIKAVETVGHLINQPDPPGHGDRGAWHNEVMGGWGEPWTYNPVGLSRAVDGMSNAGKIIFTAKWGLPDANCYTFADTRKSQHAAWSFPDSRK